MRKERLNNSQSVYLYLYRIVLAEMVVVGHGLNGFGITVLKDNSHFMYIQSFAVIGFLLISGFFSYGSYCLKETTMKDYMKNKFLRIYIYYFPALVFVAFADQMIRKIDSSYIYAQFEFSTFIRNLLMFPYHTKPFGSALPFWTLFVEWWLYVLFSFFFMVFLRKIRNCEVKSFDIFLLTILIWIIFEYSYVNCENGMLFVAFIVGVLIGIVFYNYDTVININKLLVFVFIVVLFFAVGLYKKNAYVFESIIVLAFLLILILFGCENNKVVNNFINKFLKSLGGATFPLYLLHATILTFVQRINGLDREEQFVVFFIVSNAMALLMYFLLDPLYKRLKYSKYFVS